ncbi:MAG: adenylyltransferase/cytidyltransferase family protein [Patescibacteria group bacterium]
MNFTKSKKVVLVGGCFDVLHPGHVIFLEKAKKAGDKLVVLLESDEKVKKLKGVKRPVHNQDERVQVLLALKSVDEVIKLPFIETEREYDEIIKKIKPDIIATAKGYENSHHHERSAKKVGAKIKYVTKIIGNHSTSRILSR